MAIVQCYWESWISEIVLVAVCAGNFWFPTNYQKLEAEAHLNNHITLLTKWGSSHLPMVLGFCKEHVGKNGILVNHVKLMDAGIQAWMHLNSDTKYSTEGQKLVNGYFLSVHDTEPQGMP